MPLGFEQIHIYNIIQIILKPTGVIYATIEVLNVKSNFIKQSFQNFFLPVNSIVNIGVNHPIPLFNLLFQLQRGEIQTRVLGQLV